VESAVQGVPEWQVQSNRISVSPSFLEPLDDAIPFEVTKNRLNGARREPHSVSDFGQSKIRITRDTDQNEPVAREKTPICSFSFRH
jgi:hypothetical protein